MITLYTDEPKAVPEHKPCSGLMKRWHAWRRSRTFTGRRGEYHWWCPCGLEYRRSAAFKDRMKFYLVAHRSKETFNG